MIRQKNTFYVVQDWMLDLDLDLTETVVLAIINGFSQDGDSTFRGSWAYLQRKAKCSRRTVARILKRLVDLGYVKKRDVFQGGVKFCEYLVDTSGVTETPVVPKLQEVVPAVHGGGVTLAPNNKDDNGGTSVPPNSENTARARENKKFDFVSRLVEAGVDPKTAADWEETRKKAGATNSETQLADLLKHFERAAKLYGMTPQECVDCAESNSWRGFSASWEKVKQYADEKHAGNRGAGRVPRYTGDTI